MRRRMVCIRFACSIGAPNDSMAPRVAYRIAASLNSVRRKNHPRSLLSTYVDFLTRRPTSAGDFRFNEFCSISTADGKLTEFAKTEIACKTGGRVRCVTYISNMCPLAHVLLSVAGVMFQEWSSGRNVRQERRPVDHRGAHLAQKRPLIPPRPREILL